MHCIWCHDNVSPNESSRTLRPLKMSSLNNASQTDLSPPWTAYMRWMLITTATRRKLGNPRVSRQCARMYRPSFRENKPKTRSINSGTGVSQASLWHVGSIKNARPQAFEVYSPDLTYMSQQNVSPLPFGKGGSYGEKIYLVEVTILKISRSGPNLCCLLSNLNLI